jgi:hypothetical protein
METNYYQKVEPMTYTMKLVFGIFASLLTLNWLIQVTFDVLAVFGLKELSYLN